MVARSSERARVLGCLTHERQHLSRLSRRRMVRRCEVRLMPPSRPYAELRAASAFSFLDGATLPEDLIGTAVQRELPAMALVDRNGVYGAPRFYTAAKKCGIRALVGSELVLESGNRVTVLVRNRKGYKNLCKLITAGAANRPKGDARFTLELIEEYAEGLHCLTRDNEA